MLEKVFAWLNGLGGGADEAVAHEMPVDGSGEPAYRLLAVPALSDNYMYVVLPARAPGHAVAIDACDAEKMARVLAREGVTVLDALLTTHYHHDHSGGNAALAARFGPGVTVVAGARDAPRTPACSRSVRDGERLELAGGLAFEVVATPCHTRGHVAYVLDAGDGQSPCAFTGDALFTCGCGRFMEGSAMQMRRSLERLVGALPPRTRVFPGHEYAVGNLRFAAALEPENAAVAGALRRAEERRERGEPAVPSTLGDEQELNPFLRVCQPCVAAASGCTDGAEPQDVMAALRRRKDTFTLMGKVITLVLDVRGAFQAPPPDEEDDEPRAERKV